jgi:hypothetical protein
MSKILGVGFDKTLMTLPDYHGIDIWYRHITKMNVQIEMKFLEVEFVRRRTMLPTVLSELEHSVIFH